MTTTALEYATPAPVESEDETFPTTRKTKAMKTTMTTTTTTTGVRRSHTMEDGGSRLFVPYRTVGVVTSGRGFFLHGNPSSSSKDAHSGHGFVTVPIGDRFQIYRTDHLTPVLVSEALPPSLEKSIPDHNDGNNDGNGNGDGHSDHHEQEPCIERIVTDGSLQVSVVAFGYDNCGNKGLGVSDETVHGVALYHRQHVVETLDLRNVLRGMKVPHHVVDMVSLGRLSLELPVDDDEDDADRSRTRTRPTNCLLVCVVCGPVRPTMSSISSTKGSNGSADDEESSSDSDETEEESSDDNDNDNDRDENNANSAMVLVAATRNRLVVWNSFVVPNFRAVCACHPPSYLNKVLLGGSGICDDKDKKERKRDKLSSAWGALVHCRKGRRVYTFSNKSRKGENDDDNNDDDNKGPSQRPMTIVTAMEPSPAVDVVAVGHSDGTVKLMNLKFDVQLFVLRHSDYDPGVMAGNNWLREAVTSLSFRTDNVASHLAVGRRDGTVSVWDIDAGNDDSVGTKLSVTSSTSTLASRGRRLVCRVSSEEENNDNGNDQYAVAHEGGLSRLCYFPGEPLLMTSGRNDNALRVHIFDRPDGTSRVLRKRVGHGCPPTLLRYLVSSSSTSSGATSDGTDAVACQILGVSDQSLRITSTVRPSLDREYGQTGKGARKRMRKATAHSSSTSDKGKTPRARDLKLPPIVGMAHSGGSGRVGGSMADDENGGGRGDLVTLHRDTANAYVWSTARHSQSGPVLRQDGWPVSATALGRTPVNARNHATAVTLSACGHMALVGTRGGVVYRYNLQSGLPRGTYPPEAVDDADDPHKKIFKKPKAAGSVARSMTQLRKATAMDPSPKQQDLRTLATTLPRRRPGHEDAVTGLAVDALQRYLLSVGSDGRLVVWNYEQPRDRGRQTSLHNNNNNNNHETNKDTNNTSGTNKASKRKRAGTPLLSSSAGATTYRLPSNSGAVCLCHFRDNGLTAVALQNYDVVVFDLGSRTFVRRFPQGHKGPITDLSFGPDGRRLFSSSLDSTLRVWDLPTGTCADWMAFPVDRPPTSLTLSSTGEFLATSHRNHKGIFLWSDRSFFRTVCLEHVYDRNDDDNNNHHFSSGRDYGLDRPYRMVGPGLATTGSYSSASTTTTNGETDDEDSLAKANAKDIDSSGTTLVTLSGLPASHWKTLFHLDLVRERNRPVEPPKKPPSAPFFLQWSADAKLNDDTPTDPPAETTPKPNDNHNEEKEPWEAAWSDDDDDNEGPSKDTTGNNDASGITANPSTQPKRRKVTHSRSRLAQLLRECGRRRARGNEYSPKEDDHNNNNDGKTNVITHYFDPVTSYLSTLGPSAIDVDLGALCHGVHDLYDDDDDDDGHDTGSGGIDLLHLAALWLLEACSSQKHYDAVQAYLHRFLHIHADVISGLGDGTRTNTGTGNEDTTNEPNHDDDHDDNDNGNRSNQGRRASKRQALLEAIQQLRVAQRKASLKLRSKLQKSLCLLRHFSRTV